MANDRRASWQSASPFLDTALDLPPEERAAWLATIRAQTPELADQIERWLAECEVLDTDGFLEGAAAVEPARAALAGLQLGAYRLTAPIGHGGMGSVWLAERTDGRYEGRVAVKLLSAALVGRAGEDRFAREGRILAKLAHPQIAHLIDAGVSGIGQPYLVLEYVEGLTIVAHCDAARLGVAERVQLFLDVLAPVAHAHANLIVHRDLKPSNVMVTPTGQVKLLDFGIARLLQPEAGPEPVAPLTRAGDALLTPAYAAPEQVSGGEISTVTDVYALGVMLYKPLTGRHPAEAVLDNPSELLRAIVHEDPALMSRSVTGGGSAGTNATAAILARSTTAARLRRALRGDLDVIVAKALRKAPEARFTSAVEFAHDLRRYLDREPIAARKGSAVYRATRFASRYRWGVAAAAVMLGGLSSALYVVSVERAVAEQRFEQVRGLANTLFDIDVQVRPLSGSSKTRQLIVDTALTYLKGLEGIEGDPRLALDVGTAYLRVARVQGVPIAPHLGQSREAEVNLDLADHAIASVLRSEPGNQTAMLRAAQIAHDRMILAGERRPSDAALPLARQSASWLERYLKAGRPPDLLSLDQVLITFNNVGNRFRIEHQYDDATRLTDQGIELARTDARAASTGQLGGLLIGLARIHRDRGDCDAALRAIREAQGLMATTAEQAKTASTRVATFVLTLSTEGQLLGNGGVSLGHPRQAVIPLQRGFDLMDPMVHRDAADALSRSSLASIGLELARNLSDLDAASALAVYDHVLRHLAEIANNPRFRRLEVQALSLSARPLRQLGRAPEVRARLDAAFDRLRELKLYPADQVELGSEADLALSALADDHASHGRLADAVGTYRTLLGLGQASKSRPYDQPGDAAELSRVLDALGSLLERAGSRDEAASVANQRRELWQQWDVKLPGNPFVRRHLTSLHP